MRRFSFTQRDRFDDDGDVDNDNDIYDKNEPDDEGEYIARVNTDEDADNNVYCYNDDFLNDDNNSDCDDGNTRINPNPHCP
jgi:hypothetical protein